MRMEKERPELWRSRLQILRVAIAAAYVLGLLGFALALNRADWSQACLTGGVAVVALMGLVLE